MLREKFEYTPRVEKLLSPGAFEIILPTICDSETARTPEIWTKENPLIGHCAIVSALAHDMFGGKIFQASLKGIPEFAYLRSHFVNELEGDIRDFTRSQFGSNYPESLDFVERTREEILCFPDTMRRYSLLRERLNKQLL